MSDELDEQAPAGSPIRVVTFNAQHGKAAPPARPPRPHFLRGGTELLVDFCADLGADLLALQEVDVRVPRSGCADQAAAAARASGMGHVFGPARRVGWKGRYGNALLSADGLEDVEVVALPRGAGEPRSALLATVVRGGLRLAVAATHLSTRPDEAGPQLDAVIEALIARPQPQVLLGDLNLGPEVVGPAVQAAGLVLADPAEPTYPAAAPRARIDHVAVGGLTITDVRVLPPAPVSDHRPLRAELS